MRRNWKNTNKPVVRNDGYYEAFLQRNAKDQYILNDSYYEQKVTDQDALMLYQHDALSRKIVNAPAEDVIKNGFKVIGDDENLIYQYLETINAEQHIVEAIRWNRLFGRSAILIIADDGGKLDEPINFKTLRKINALVVFDKRDITEDISYFYLTSDPASPNFGKPEYYRITPPNGNQLDVHYSRLLVFNGESMPWRERIANDGAGLSCLDGMIKAIRRIGASHARMMDAVERLSTSMLKLDGLMEMVQSQYGTQVVQQRLNLIDLARNMLNTVAIDKNDDYQLYSMNVGGIPQCVQEFEQIVSGMSAIPMTILFGRSPGGENSTGDSDFENYYNMVRRIQKVDIKPKLEYLCKLVQLCSEGPFKGKELKNWSVEFNELKQPTELDKANTVKAKRDARTAEFGLLNQLIQAQMLDPTDAKQFLADEGEIPVTEGEIEAPTDGMPLEEMEEQIAQDQEAKAQIAGESQQMRQTPEEEPVERPVEESEEEQPVEEPSESEGEPSQEQEEETNTNPQEEANKASKEESEGTDELEENVEEEATEEQPVEESEEEAEGEQEEELKDENEDGVVDEEDAFIAEAKKYAAEHSKSFKELTPEEQEKIKNRVTRKHLFA